MENKAEIKPFDWLLDRKSSYGNRKWLVGLMQMVKHSLAVQKSHAGTYSSRLYYNTAAQPSSPSLLRYLGSLSTQTCMSMLLLLLSEEIWVDNNFDKII